MKTICGSSCSIIDIAGDFYNAYYRCIKGENPREDEYGRKVTDVVNIPAIVNGAFAIELYLKSMIDPLKLQGEGTHNIEGLFLLLEKEIKEELENNIKEKLPELIKPINKEEFERNHIAKKEIYSFEECLRGISEAFPFWRYIFEKEELKFGFNETMRIIPVFLENIRNCAEKNKKNVDINNNN